MKTYRILIITLAVVVSIFFLAFVPITPNEIIFKIPKGWPQPSYKFSKYPLTEEGFQLGRSLFYDPILSRDGTVSCSSCHNQSSGFTHVDHSHSHGIDGKIGNRNSPSLMNLSWNTSFMWDGSINNIEVQAIAPITNPAEMDETLEHVVKKINSSHSYKQRFEKVFGDSVVTGQFVLLALTEFLIQLNTSNSKYDKHVRNEIGGKYTPEEESGFALFKKNCATCHAEPLFTNNLFENNGLPVDDGINDIGRMRITQNPNDSLKFKVPTLRNIQYSAPYMHDGRFVNLTQVLNHYTNGLTHTTTLSAKLSTPILLNDTEKKNLIAFLMTLTDNEFLQNLRFSFPKNSQ